MASTMVSRELVSAAGRCVVFDHGAHVTSWIPDGGSEVLWLSDASAYAPDTAIRGGVPICFPWFGGGRSGAMTPAHGFARLSDWQFEGLHHEGEVVGARFVLDTASARSDAWPFACVATLDVQLDEQLTIGLTVANVGDVALSFEEALHTYLRVGDVREVSVDGLASAPYADKVDGRTHEQSGPVRFVGETDRVYESTSTLTLHDPILGRDLRLAKTASADTVVWNPAAERAARLSDVSAGAWTQFCCLETANVVAHAVVLEPGQAHRMGFVLTASGVFS